VAQSSHLEEKKTLSEENKARPVSWPPLSGAARRQLEKGRNPEAEREETDFWGTTPERSKCASLVVTSGEGVGHK